MRSERSILFEAMEEYSEADDLEASLAIKDLLSSKAQIHCGLKMSLKLSRSDSKIQLRRKNIPERTRKNSS